MTTIEKVLYTGKTHTTGGREGAAQSSDRALDVKLSPPGSGRPGTNPEQLFAAGWSACFIGAIGLAAGKRKIRLPAEAAVASVRESLVSASRPAQGARTTSGRAEHSR